MRISVVVPAHNEQEALPRCLAALENQELRDFELIVVDSASTDATAQVARAHGAKVVRVDELGLARARQAGFEAASGEVIASTDADSTPPPHWLARLVSPFSRPQVVGAYGGLALAGEGISTRVAERLFLVWQRINHALSRPIFCGPNFAVRRDAFFRVGGFKRGSEYYPDDETDLRLAFKLLRVGEVVFLPDLLVPTSTRRLSGGERARYLLRHTRNYFRTCWLRYGDV